MAKILIVEDDEFLREIFTDYLTEKGHVVVSVPNGKVARDCVLAGEFELVVSDVQMPFLNGVELLQWLRERSQIPFILMTGFTNLLETQKASDLGANGFLTKPFSNQALLDMVADVLKPVAAAVPPENEDANYCKVPLDEFVARPLIEYDIYIRLQSSRYLKVAHLGETLDINRLKSYATKGMTHLHVRKEDFNKVVGFNIQLSKIIQGSDKVSEEKKMRFMRYTGEVIMERCFVTDMDRVSFEDASQFFNASMAAMASQPETFQLAQILNEHSDHLYAHCLGVAIYSIMIAKKMNFQSTQTCFKLAMAGLFHDIGSKEIERDLLNKARPLLSVTERKMVESHVQRGRDIMTAIPGVHSDVLQIIYEHHEDDVQQGYPNQTPKLKLHPLSRIVHVADIFVTHAIRSPAHPGASTAGAIAHIEKFELDRVNLQAYEALKRLIVKRAA